MTDERIIGQEGKLFVPGALKEAVIKAILLGFKHCQDCY